MTYLNGFHIVARTKERDITSDYAIYKVVEQLSDNLIAQPVATGGEPLKSEPCAIFGVTRLKAGKLFASYNAALLYDTKMRTGNLPTQKVRVPITR
ncbi:hypothetical protein [Agrobacterium burrii]|uniref:Uncharacterized protein n=1 Tax=Agrobacterium burrii TaxID=2815339 RepID=A0ABS3EK79_9HYPH|nr:hypothetical protein [Agrobacterium burrii]MBO0132375.1 hypothetical protein [Agrobacterium burrii]